MKDKYIKLKIQAIINKALYKKNEISKISYEQISKQIDKLLFEEIKK